MAVQKKILRGLRDLRTLSGRVDAGSIPYMGYMKIASLEMERARRGKEKDSALHRIQSIDARFQDIEGEKNKLLLALGERRSMGGPRRMPGPADNAGDPASTEGMRIKY